MRNIMKKSYFRYAVVLLLSMLLAPLSLQAQNVTIGPDNGSLITGQAGGNVDDSGIGRGMASMWRHEQLPLTMTTSDIANLTGSGELQDPSCAIDIYNGNLIIGAGQTQTFMVVSLPKGYRITGYRLVLQPNISGTIQLHPGKDSWDIGTNDQMSFFETPAWGSGSPYGNNTHSNQMTCPDSITAAHEIGNESNTLMENNTAENRAKEFVITRTSKTPTDMTNQLHFFFAASATGQTTPYRYALTIKSFELYFTAEGTFDAEAAPAAPGPATSMAKSPFTTSKMDVGAVVEKNGLYTYDYTGVRDLIAYTYLYQEDAVMNGKPADVATNKHIYPLVVDGQGAYAFGQGTYFIEPPTTITTSSGWESPIGFRVVGATFDCQWGTATTGGEITVNNGYRISVRYNNQNYYLNDNLDFVQTTQANAFVWSSDEFGNLYTGTDYKRYLSCFGTGNDRILSLSSAASGHEATWNLRVRNDGRVYYHSDGGNDYLLNYQRIQEGSAYHLRGHVSQNPSNDNLASAASTGGTHTTNLPSFTPGAYTLEVYGTDKTTPIQTITVNSAADVTKYTTPKLNNDAVMFKITSVADGCQALVNVTLQLEALNPYINSMDIVCESEEDAQGKKLELVQTFTANDFKVSGGKFIFYIPTDYYYHDLTFTFKDLYSQYGDESYGGTHNSRYSYVTSDYFLQFDGDGDGGLYDPHYDPNYPSTTKIYTSVAGNNRFEFNNAEELTGGGSEAQFLKEYPFSVSKYLSTYDPDGSGNIGQFSLIQMNASVNTQRTGIYYVFTADETRYNIAPTTDWQHRSFAFYRMDIELVAKNYIPKLEWTKVYDQTLYVAENGSAAEDDMWGLTLRVQDTDEGGNVFDVEEGTGYLSVKEILEAFEAEFNSKGDGLPTDAKQILYIDGSKLQTIVASAGDYSLESLKAQLAPNALIYLPENMTSTADNFAYKTAGGSFNAGKDIVLIDRQPFYAPYDIQVDAANKAIHERQVTNDKNGKVASATIILPFDILVDSEGKHVNADGTSPAFSLHQMQASNCLTDEAPADQADAEEYVYFPVIQVASATLPNKPYLVKVLEPGDDSNVSFVASQKGALIKATTGMDKNSYTFAGESASGTAKDGNYSFTAYGSYSGKKVAKDANNVVFYFASNMFLSTQELNKPYLNVAPFRSYYASVAPTGAKLSTLSIIFGEGEGNADAIRDLRVKEADLAVQAGRGTLTIASKADNNVRVSGINGISRYNFNMKAGDVKTVSVPAGIYVVNGVKILVK